MKGRRGGSTSATTLAVRAAVAVVVALHLRDPSAGDAAVARLWEFALGNRVFRLDSFEPLLVVVAFQAYMVVFWSLNRVQRATGVLSRFKLDKRNSADQDPRHYLAGLVYLLPIVAFDVVAPRRAAILDAAPAAPSLVGLVGQVVAALAAYDLFFFFGHYAMHRWAYGIHAKHHKAAVIEAHDTYRLSVAEGIVDVSFSIAALNALGTHPLARAVYNVVIVGLLCGLHCGYDMPMMVHHIVGFGLMHGPPGHQLHHTRKTVNFAKFFTYLDRLAGTHGTFPFDVSA